MDHPVPPHLFQILSLFSVETGLESAAAYALADRNFRNPKVSAGIRAEFEELLVDPAFSWLHALDDGHHLTVYSADSEEDARAYVVDLLWRRYFSDDAPPVLHCS